MFKVGDLIKKPTGRTIFKVTRIIKTRRWGRSIEVENLTSGRLYSTSFRRWVKYDPFTPNKESNNFKHSFEHGV